MFRRPCFFYPIIHYAVLILALLSISNCTGEIGTGAKGESADPTDRDSNPGDENIIAELNDPYTEQTTPVDAVQLSYWNNKLYMRSLKKGRLWYWSHTPGDWLYWRVENGGEPQNLAESAPWNLPGGPCGEGKACHFSDLDISAQGTDLDLRVIQKGYLWHWHHTEGKDPFWVMQGDARPMWEVPPFNLAGGPCSNNEECDPQSITYDHQGETLFIHVVQQDKLWVFKNQGSWKLDNVAPLQQLAPFNESGGPCENSEQCEIASLDFVYNTETNRTLMYVLRGMTLWVYEQAGDSVTGSWSLSDTMNLRDAEPFRHCAAKDSKDCFSERRWIEWGVTGLPAAGAWPFGDYSHAWGNETLELAVRDYGRAQWCNRQEDKVKIHSQLQWDFENNYHQRNIYIFNEPDEEGQCKTHSPELDVDGSGKGGLPPGKVAAREVLATIVTTYGIAAEEGQVRSTWRPYFLIGGTGSNTERWLPQFGEDQAQGAARVANVRKWWRDMLAELKVIKLEPGNPPSWLKDLLIPEMQNKGSFGAMIEYLGLSGEKCIGFAHWCTLPHVSVVGGELQWKYELVHT